MATHRDRSVLWLRPSRALFQTAWGAGVGLERSGFKRFGLRVGGSVFRGPEARVAWGSSGFKQGFALCLAHRRAEKLCGDPRPKLS